MVVMSSAYYSNEEAVLNRQIELPEEKDIDEENFNEVYDIERCSEYIKNHKNVTKVGLQFPDYMLYKSFKICKALERNNFGVSFFVLADTSFGSCDVDEVAGQHIDVDLIIHYGDAALSPTASVSSLYVFDKCLSIDIEQVIKSFYEKFPEKLKTRIVLLHDVSCHHAMDHITKVLMIEYPYLSKGLINIPELPKGRSSADNNLPPEEESIIKDLCQKACPGCSCRLGNTKLDDNITESDENHPEECRDFLTGHFTIPLETTKELKDYSVFFIGSPDSTSLKNLTTEHPQCKVYLYNSYTNLCSNFSTNTNKMLMKQYYLVEKVKDAKTVGILVGTMAVAGYLDYINHVKALLKFANKKSYLFLMGKLNPEKLANFMEIDLFVLIASSENMEIDNSQFYKPVVSPYVLEVACNPNRDWTGEYVTDFRNFLSGGKNFVALPEESDDSITVSLISGNIRTMGQGNKDETLIKDGIGTDVVPKNDENKLDVLHEHSAVTYLKNRTWAGLEQDIGKTKVEKAKVGRSGIAYSYISEPNS